MRVVVAIAGNMRAMLDAGADEISAARRAKLEAGSSDLLDDLRNPIHGTALEKLRHCETGLRP